MNFKLKPHRILIASICLLTTLTSAVKGAGAFENYLAQRNNRYPHDGYRNDRYPHDGYGNDRYPRDGYRNDIYRYNGQGQFDDGERNYYCDTLIVDFDAPRARIKCDRLQITFQKGSNRNWNNMNFYVLQFDEDRYYSDRYDGEMSCYMNGETQERLNRFSCEGVYRDQDNRSRRFRTNFQTYSPGKPLTDY